MLQTQHQLHQFGLRKPLEFLPIHRQDESHTGRLGKGLGNYKINGRKRHILIERPGPRVGVIVHTADLQGRDVAPDVLSSIRQNVPWLSHVFADGGYAGNKPCAVLATIGTWTLEIIKRSDVVNAGINWHAINYFMKRFSCVGLLQSRLPQ